MESNVIIRFLASLIITVFLPQMASSQIALAFAGTPTLTGTGGTVGAKYTYANVGTSGSVTIKATIEITAISGARLDNIDGPVSAGGTDNAFQPVISGSQTSGNCWSISFRISFFDAANNSPLTLSSFRANGIDIDGNGSTLREYNTFLNPDSYTLENPTNLTVTPVSGGYKFQSPSTSYSGIAVNQTNVAVTCQYSNSQYVDLVIGSCCVGGSCSAASGSGRQHSINFYDAVPYSSPTVVLPVTLLQFSGRRESSGVFLSWSTTDEMNFSHFIVQKSSDGYNFADLGTIEPESDHNYNYTDHAVTDESYYRLKVVDIDGKFTYSRILRISTKIDDDAALSISPNPVTDVVNLTINSDKTQQVSIRVLGSDGKLVKTIPKNIFAGTNQVILSADLLKRKGVYFVQVLSASGVKTAKVVKF